MNDDEKEEQDGQDGQDEGEEKEADKVNSDKPEPEGSPSSLEAAVDAADICVARGDVPPNCAVCDWRPTCTSPAKVDTETLTVEPVASLSTISADVRAVFTPDELTARLKQGITSALHRESIDKYKMAILRHMELNQTKGLDICAATVIYLQLLTVPPGLLGIYAIQLICDCINAHEELSADQIHVKFTTPVGMKPN